METTRRSARWVVLGALAVGLAFAGCKKKASTEESGPASTAPQGSPTVPAAAGTVPDGAAAGVEPAPPAKTVCLTGTAVFKGPDGSLIGTGGTLLRYAFEPAQKRIRATSVSFDSPLGEPPQQLEIALKVDGNRLEFQGEQFSGTGELRGDAWVWTSWSMQADLPQGMRMNTEETLTDAGMDATDEVLGPAGNVAIRIVRSLTAGDCDTWENHRAGAAAGTVHLADLGLQAAAPEGGADDGTGKWREEEITFESRGRRVAGTIAYPLGDGPFPAVLFHAGSGPSYRDWNNSLIPGTNGSAKLLAHVLAENGFASLRFDKLGTGKTEIPAAVASGEELVGPQHYLDDVKAGIQRLATDAKVDPARIFMAGNSEGGLYTLETAMDPESGLAGIVLLASQGAAQGPTMLRQIRAQFEQIMSREEADARVAKLQNLIDAIVAGRELPPAREVSDDPAILNVFMPLVVPAAKEFAPWVLTWDPTTAFAGIKLPVLILQGEKDVQIGLDTDANPLYQAAKAAGLEDVTLVVLPNSDHVFKLEETPKDQLGSMAAVRYNAAGRRLDPEAVEALLTWLRAHAGTQGPRPADGGQGGGSP